MLGEIMRVRRRAAHASCDDGLLLTRPSIVRTTATVNVASSGFDCRHDWRMMEGVVILWFRCLVEYSLVHLWMEGEEESLCMEAVWV